MSDEDDDQDGGEGAPIGLSMVLLDHEPTELDAARIAALHREHAPDAPALAPGWAEDGGEDDGPEREGLVSASLHFADGQGRVVLAVLPPIPGGEAEAARRLSVASLRADAPEPAPHRAHVLVTLLGVDDRLDALRRLTWVSAAVARATDATGVHWGAGSVTHDADFFLDVTKALGPDDLPITLWCGVSVAEDQAGRSLLSWGMDQFGLDELLLRAGDSLPPRALELFFDLMHYAAKRGAAVPAGETVGRSAGEKLVVREAPHPTDPERTVWCVDLAEAEPAAGGGGLCLVALALLIAGAAGAWFVFLR